MQSGTRMAISTYTVHTLHFRLDPRQVWLNGRMMAFLGNGELCLSLFWLATRVTGIHPRFSIQKATSAFFTVKRRKEKTTKIYGEFGGRLELLRAIGLYQWKSLVELCPQPFKAMTEQCT